MDSKPTPLTLRSSADSPSHYQDWLGRRVLVRTKESHPIQWAGTIRAVRRWRLRPPSEAKPLGKLGESPVMLLVQPHRGRGSQWCRPNRLELVEDWPEEATIRGSPAPLGDQTIPSLWHQRQAIRRATKAKREAKRQRRLQKIRATQRTPTPTIPKSGCEREIVSGL